VPLTNVRIDKTKHRDDNSGTSIQYSLGTRPDGPVTRIIFYPWVALVPDPNREGYGACIFFTRG
jgi:hypothetical protein